jgi:hypothetical protein
MRPAVAARTVCAPTKISRWLLARAARPTAVLATEVDNEPAIEFYKNRGWETILPEIRIGRLYRVMGREEPATPTRSSTAAST